MILKPRTATVTLFQGDDLAEIATLRDEVERVGNLVKDPLLLGEIDPVLAAATAHDAFVEEARGRALTVTLTALSRIEWRDLTRAHEKREESAEDARLSVNMDTFPAELLVASMVKSGTGEHEARALIDQIRDADYNMMFSAAWSLNRADVADPKAGLASAVTRVSDAMSK